MVYCLLLDRASFFGLLEMKHNADKRDKKTP